MDCIPICVKYVNVLIESEQLSADRVRLHNE